jgi:cytochrome c-type biogenesis protein CcmE
MSKKTVRVLITVLVLGGAFATLVATSLRENVEYFKHVDEVMPAAADWYGKPLRLHGFVVEGSIGKRPDSRDYRFNVKHGESIVQASYSGIVPDTFKDGAEVVMQGRLSPEGFQVEPSGITAKCPSKYEESTAPNLVSGGMAQ